MAKERRDSKNRLLAKGEYQKSDGRYMYRYTDQYGNAGYVYSWTLTKTDRTPKGKTPGPCLRDLEKEIAKDVIDGINLGASKKVTVDDYFEIYMAQKKGIKESTRFHYKYNYNTLVKDRIGSMRIADVKFSDVKRLYVDLIAEKGHTVGSVQNIHAVLYPIFKLAVRDDVISKNPLDGMITEIKDEYGRVKKKKRALTGREQARLIQYIEGHHKYMSWYPLVIFLLGTGCRIGEACGLTWDDLNFKNNEIHIRRSLSYFPDPKTGKCRFQIQTPKTASGERTLPMFKEVCAVLQDVRMNQLTHGFCSDEVDGVSGFVFITEHNKVLNPRTFGAALRTIVTTHNSDEKLKSIGFRAEPFYLPNISPHILRHTFCTRLCEIGIDVKIVQEMMGHANVSMTLEIYADVTKDHKAQVFKSLEGKLQLG